MRANELTDKRIFSLIADHTDRQIKIERINLRGNYLYSVVIELPVRANIFLIQRGLKVKEILLKTN